MVAGWFFLPGCGLSGGAWVIDRAKNISIQAIWGNERRVSNVSGISPNELN